MKLAVSIVSASLLLSSVGAMAQPVPSSAATSMSIDEAREIVQAKDRGRFGAVLEYLQAAALEKNGPALLLLGDIYAAGDLVESDGEKAVGYYREASAVGLKFATFKLAEAYREGTLVPADPEEAVKLYQSLSEANMPLAKIKLGEAYLSGEGVVQDVAHGLRLLEEAAELGEQAALNKLGALYSQPDLVDDDYAKAVSYYERSAALGNIGAKLRLGDIYLTGTVAPKNVEKAVEYLEDAAGAGSDFASVLLANAHLRGDLDSRSDPEKGLNILQDLSNKGFSPATVSLADTYYWGRGTPKRPAEAVSLLNAAVEKGDGSAAQRLIYFLRDAPNKAIKRDLKRAAAVYEQAASTMEPKIALREKLLLSAATNPDRAAFAEVAKMVGQLPQQDRSAAISALRYTNPNAFVYYAQHRLREKGVYDGALNGLLTSSTIRALNGVCSGECRRGPLAPQSVRALSAVLAE